MMSRESGPVVAEEDTEWGGKKLTFKDGSCVQVTRSHWDNIVKYVRTDAHDPDKYAPRGDPR